MNNQIRFINEPVIVTNSDGELSPYIPTNITTNREAYSASLDMIFKHVADLHIKIVHIIADKYNLDPDEIINEVINNPMYINMQGEVNGLGYIDTTVSQEKEIKKVVKLKRKLKVSSTKEESKCVENLAADMKDISIDSSQNKKRNIA